MTWSWASDQLHRLEGAGQELGSDPGVKPGATELITFPTPTKLHTESATAALLSLLLTSNLQFASLQH